MLCKLSELFRGNGKRLKVARWILLVVCWVLILTLLGRASHYAYDQAFLQLGPEKIVGASAVIYEEAPGYLYTNPVAMMELAFRRKAIDYGITLLATTLATILMCALFRLQRIRTRILPMLFGVAMFLLFCYLAMVGVWEWGLAWLVLLGCARFFPQWSVKSRFTVMAWIVAMVILGWRRNDFKAVSRQYDAFWNSAEKCATMEQFTENFGKPVILIRNASEEHQEWFENLAQFNQNLWLPGNTLAGFISPQMPELLLLPWFDEEGRRIILAWCDLTPERRELLAKCAILYQE